MKIYLAMAYRQYYPSGGMDDCKGISLDFDKAMQMLDEHIKEQAYDYYGVETIDTETLDSKWTKYHRAEPSTVDSTAKTVERERSEYVQV